MHAHSCTLHAETNAFFSVTSVQKHHYRELSEEAQQSLGEIPDKFIDYWTQRFPLLLLHTWIRMQSVKNEPIFSQYYHKDYVFSQILYINVSKDVCSTYSNTALADNNLNVMQHWMRKRSPSDNTTKDKTQMVDDLNERQYFEHNNLQARKDNNMSPHVRRRTERQGHRKENSPKRFQSTGRDSYASKYENWRAEDDPVRQLYQKMDLVRTMDDMKDVDHSRNINNIQYSRGSPEKLISWRDEGRQTDTRQMLDRAVIREDSDSVERLEVEKIDQSDITQVSEMENLSVLTADYNRQSPSPGRQRDKQVKNDVRNRPVKKRHRHKSADTPVVWMLSKPAPPRND
jgi:hypothetical protein